MQIQAITNLRSHNNYQAKTCNIAKNYSTLPMAVDTFTPSVAFKGLGGGEFCANFCSKLILNISVHSSQTDCSYTEGNTSKLTDKNS